MNSHKSFKKRLLPAAVVAAMVASAPSIVMAQTSDATLRGTASPNTSVTARNVATGATRVTQSSKDGSFAIVGLPSGTYEVKTGAGVQKTIQLNVASISTVDLTAAAPAAANAKTLGGVSVTAATVDVPEVTTSEVGNIVSTRDIAALPEASRNFLELADIVPGMVFTRNADGTTSLRSGAQASSNINVYIDGVGQKNYVLQGGVTGQNASQGNPFPQLAVGSYKVITSNYKAEYDQISSAAITAETKSGTNEFHGDVFGSFTNTRMRAQTPTEVVEHDKTQSHEKDYGFDFGGPIIKDKAHFYVAYEGKEFDTPTTVAPGVAGYAGYLPADVQAQVGTANLPFKENDWFGKLDFEPTDHDRFELSGKYRDETSISGIGGVNTTTAGLNTTNTDKRVDLRWDHSAYSWFNRLQLTYEDAFFTPTPILLGSGAAYTPALAALRDQTILQTGNSPLAQQNKGQKGPAIQDDLTFNDLEWNGDHVIKMGFKYKAVKLTAQDAGDTNALFDYAVSPNGTESIPYQVQFGQPNPGLSPVVTSSDKQFGVYVQDDWTVDDHLTLNVGVRWDYEKTPSYLNWVTPANVVNAFQQQDPNAPAGQTYAQTLAMGGVNINDYISTGHNRHAQTNEIQPRFGFSYDINGDQKHVIFGGIGRSYDRDLYEALQVEQTKLALSQPTLNFNTPDVPCTVGVNNCFAWNPAYLNIPTLQGLIAGTTAGQEVDMINNKLKAPYSDQFSIGMRNQVGDWNTSAAFTAIRSYDGLVYTLGNRYPNGSFWQSGGQPWNNGIPGFGSLIIGNNGVQTRVNEVLLSANKPYTTESHWGATIAYTLSHASQQGGGADSTDQYAFDYATIGDYPFVPSAVPKHRLVMSGTLDGPWGFVLGAKLTLSTPTPDLNTACYGAPATNVDSGGTAGSGCRAVGIAPPGSGRFLVGGKIFGYRDIDFQATKNFKLYGNLNAYVRFDLINAFNWNNYTGYLENWGANGVMNRTPVNYATIANFSTYGVPPASTGYPRTVKLSIGLSF